MDGVRWADRTSWSLRIRVRAAARLVFELALHRSSRRCERAARTDIHASLVRPGPRARSWEPRVWARLRFPLPVSWPSADERGRLPLRIVRARGPGARRARDARG